MQSEFLTHTLISRASRALEDLLQNQIINPTVFARAQLDLDRFRAELQQQTLKLRNLKFRDVLERVPLFATLGERELAQVEAFSRRHKLRSGSVLFRQGEAGNSLYVVLSGILEVNGPTIQHPRVFAGSFLGELSLLFQVPRTATVTALVDCDLVEIESLLFRQLQALSPPFQQHVDQIARQRK